MNKRQKIYLVVGLIAVVVLGGVIWSIYNQQQKASLSQDLGELRLSSMIVTDRVETLDELNAQKDQCLKAEELIEKTKQYYGEQSEKSKKATEYAAICREYTAFVKPYQFKDQKVETNEYKNLLTYEGECQPNGCVPEQNYAAFALIYKDIYNSYNTSYAALKDKPSAFADAAHKPYSEVLKTQLKSYRDITLEYLNVLEGKSSDDLGEVANRSVTVDATAAQKVKELSEGQFNDYTSFFKDYLEKSEKVLEA